MEKVLTGKGRNRKGVNLQFGVLKVKGTHAPAVFEGKTIKKVTKINYPHDNCSVSSRLSGPLSKFKTNACSLNLMKGQVSGCTIYQELVIYLVYIKWPLKPKPRWLKVLLSLSLLLYKYTHYIKIYIILGDVLNSQMLLRKNTQEEFSISTASYSKHVGFTETRELLLYIFEIFNSLG